MSNQSNPQEVKQYLLEQLDADKQTIQELNDDELKKVAGGMGKWGHIAAGAAASYFVPQLLGGLFGGGSSSQSQSQSQSTTGQTTTTTQGH